MFARVWLALSLLISYLLTVGTGFINAPAKPRYAIAESHAHQVHHHQDRYADFNGMDLGLDELPDLNVHPNEDASAPPARHQVVTGVDAHCLPGASCFPFIATCQINPLAVNYPAVALAAVYHTVDVPPW